MAESFYGGRRGASVIIVKSYDSIQEMERDFSSINCSVDYDNYVVVNQTINNVQSSVLYRRTLDGPVKIGTLGSTSGGNVPSSGGYLNLILTTPDKIDNPDGSGEYNTTNSLVPGYYTDAEGNPLYNDSIKWVYTNIIEEDGTESKTYIGFTFPYPVIDFQASMVDKNDDDHPIIKRLDDGTHPFYNKWSLNIPKGSQGSSFQNLRVVSASQIYTDYPNGFSDGTVLQDEDLNSQHLIYDYNNTDTGVLETYYLGKYTIIENVNFSDDGTLSFIFNGNKNVSFDKIKWISSIKLTEDGTLTFNYNNGTSEIFEKYIRTIKTLSLTETGLFTISDNQGNTIEEQLKWPVNLVMESYADGSQIEGSGSQKLKLTYNNGDSEYISPPINYILETAIDDKFHLLVFYSDPEKRKNLQNKVTYNGIDGWADLGAVKSDSGILIGQQYSETTSIDVAIAALNDNYPNGLTGEDKGKVVTAGKADQNKNFFAFDYNGNKWYYLGTFGVSDFKDAFLIAERDALDIEERKDNIKVGGVWYILEEIDSE